MNTNSINRQIEGKRAANVARPPKLYVQQNTVQILCMHNLNNEITKLNEQNNLLWFHVVSFAFSSTLPLRIALIFRFLQLTVHNVCITQCSYHVPYFLKFTVSVSLTLRAQRALKLMIVFSLHVLFRFPFFRIYSCSACVSIYFRFRVVISIELHTSQKISFCHHAFRHIALICK